MKAQLKELHAKGNPVPPCKLAKPRTINQSNFMKALNTHPLVVGMGFAGTGKTFCTGMVAAGMLTDKKVKRIVLTRAPIPTGRSIGFLPGTVQEKMEPWLAPITSVLIDGLGKGKYETMFGTEIVIQPLETVRGQSFEDCFIIVDEAQNLNLEELKALTTRLGEGSHMALIGDPQQSDVKNGTDLVNFVNMCINHDISIPMFEFTIDEIQRSDMCKQLVRMFYEEGM